MLQNAYVAAEQPHEQPADAEALAGWLHPFRCSQLHHIPEQLNDPLLKKIFQK